VSALRIRANQEIAHGYTFGSIRVGALPKVVMLGCGARRVLGSSAR
jgi:hypothetical protein